MTDPKFPPENNLPAGYQPPKVWTWEPGNGGAPVAGQSTENGTVKERLYRHNFTGAQHQLVGLRNPALEQESLALLRASATPPAPGRP